MEGEVCPFLALLTAPLIPSVCLLNYKADGTPFWNQFFVAALRDAEGNVVNFVGVQCEVSKATVESQVSAGRTDCHQATNSFFF